jgi:hypothetical protein
MAGTFIGKTWVKRECESRGCSISSELTDVISVTGTKCVRSKHGPTIPINRNKILRKYPAIKYDGCHFHPEIYEDLLNYPTRTKYPIVNKPNKCLKRDADSTLESLEFNIILYDIIYIIKNTISNKKNESF